MRGLVSVMALALVACSPNPAQKSAEPAAPPAAEAPRTELATVATPLAGERAVSPLVATGIAPGDWYFEAVFAASLVGADGKVIAEAPARAQTDWTAPGPKVFVAELPFTVTADTPATLILQEDMPPEDAPPREVRIQVVLTPG
jgi:hypothetical protein